MPETIDPLREPVTFGDAFVEQLKNAPWFLISLAIHAVIFIILHLISANPAQAKKDPGIIEVSAPEEIEEPEEEEEVEEETEEVEPEEEVTEDPVIKETEISDHNETDNQEEFEESKGEEDLLSDKPFDGTQTNDAVGFGGGFGGSFGGRRGGSRNLRQLALAMQEELMLRERQRRAIRAVGRARRFGVRRIARGFAAFPSPVGTRPVATRRSRPAWDRRGANQGPAGQFACIPLSFVDQ